MNMDVRVRSLICLIILICIGYSESQSSENHCGERVPCDEGQCIAREKWCDGRTDCYDESDEKYCKTSSWFKTVDNKCTDQHFTCENSQCVPAVTKCDEYKNCKDGSDEYYCGEKSSEPSLSSGDSNSEDKLDNNTDDDFWDTSVASSNETPDTFESPKYSAVTTPPSTTPPSTTPPSTTPPSTTTDYYGRVVSETINQQKQTERNRQFGYNSHPENHQQPYRSGQNEPGQQSQYPSATFQTHTRIAPNGQNLHHSQTSHSSPHYSGGSDTAPTASFPSNAQRPLSPLPVYSRDPLPPTTDPITFPPSSLSVDRDAVELPRNYHHQRQPQPSYPARDHTAGHYPMSDRRDPFNDRYSPNARRRCRIYLQQRNSIPSVQQKIPLPPFHFQQSYSNEHRYGRTIQEARRWLEDQRNKFYGWGDDTPRALVALSLITNSFLSNIAENNFMKKSLQAHLGIKMLTELNKENFHKDKENTVKLAHYINALLATCQDPKDFFGKDLVELLLQAKRDEVNKYRSVNPFIYITLCLVNAPITRNDVENVEDVLNSDDPDESSKDMRILATTALACFHHNYPNFRVEKTLEQASRNLLNTKFSDGSFGSVYSTAIAAQALISIDRRFDLKKTRDYLQQNQSDDGSFGDMLATYYILPVLSGRSLLHLRNTECEPPTPVVDKDWSPLDILNYPGPKVQVSYTVKVGNPPTSTIPTHISVPEDTSFFDILRIIQLLNPVFKFSYKEIADQIEVHTISNIPNDPERNYYWHLYDRDGELNSRGYQEYTGDIRDLCPANHQHMVYWYY